nr:unnamed protein product [Haemonchus contortus]
MDLQEVVSRFHFFHSNNPEDGCDDETVKENQIAAPTTSCRPTAVQYENGIRMSCAKSMDTHPYSLGS